MLLVLAGQARSAPGWLILRSTPSAGTRGVRAAPEAVLQFAQFPDESEYLMFKRPALSAVLAAAALALVMVPSTATAAPSPGPHEPAFIATEEAPYIQDTRVAGVSLRYTCYGPGTVINVSLTVEGVEAKGSAPVVCHGDTDAPVGVRLDVPKGSSGFPVGTWNAVLVTTIPDQVTQALFQQVTVPAPLLKTVKLTINASPEKVAQGKRITVKGTIERDGKRWPQAQADLRFKVDGGNYLYVRTVTADDKGVLKTTLPSTTSGSFRYAFTGSPTLAEATSHGDHIVVKKLKPKSYASCSALNEIYAYGVGRAGGREKGLGVNNWTRDTNTYKKNKKLDPDEDGVACEKR
ncbi:hypothetical protein GCM10009593_38400 [Microlunatus antarcticus]